MSSVALKKGVEEPWAMEGGENSLICSLFGDREITLKSDAEPAISASRNRAAETCKAEVTTEDALKGDKPSSGLIENTVLILRGITRTIKCHIDSSTQEELTEDSQVLPWSVEHEGSILSRCHKGRGGRRPFERLHARRRHKSSSHWLRRCWRGRSHQNLMNSRSHQNP